MKRIKNFSKKKKGSIAFLPEEILLIIGVLVIAVVILLILNILSMVPGTETVKFRVDAIDFPAPRNCDVNLMNLMKFDAPKPDFWGEDVDFTYATAIAHLEFDLDYIDPLTNSLAEVLNEAHGPRAWGLEANVEGTTQILSMGIPFSKDTFECITIIPSFDFTDGYIEVKLILPEAKGL